MNESNADDRGFAFDGDWREFASIAFTNLLLSIVTLGVYSFWARARERRYLWSRTRFIDDRLEWTGTGLELFIGYLLAFGLFLIPFALLNLTVQSLAINGRTGLAALVLIVAYLALLYLMGVAIFRGLRYRLSRTYWHGIRGGSDDQGLRFGLSYLWKTLAGGLAAGLLVPWAMTSLWNERWNAMSFGPLRFESAAHWGALMMRYLLYYLAPVILFIAIIVAVAVVGPQEANREELGAQLAVGVVLGYIGFFIVLGLIALLFYAAYFREVVGKLSLGELDFEFDARTIDWLKLFIVNVALVIFTLGIGAIFLGYRNWGFFIRHMRAYGTIDLDGLTQSATRAPGQGEGLLDAFDVGAI